MKVVVFGHNRDELDLHTFVLRQAGLQPVASLREERLVSICTEERPDLVIIDATSKDIDLPSLIAKVRSDWDGPIMTVSSASDEEHVIAALDQGADDYLVKPHSPRMLVARARALLRRTQPVPLSALGPITIQGLTLDPEQHLVLTPTGSTVHLTNMEFRLLFLLMKNPDRVIPSETIIERVWGYTGVGEATLVKNLVSRVRRKVEPDPAHPRYVRTVPGVGYSFSSSEVVDST